MEHDQGGAWSVSGTTDARGAEARGDVELVVRNRPVLVDGPVVELQVAAPRLRRPPGLVLDVTRRPFVLVAGSWTARCLRRADPRCRRGVAAQRRTVAASHGRAPELLRRRPDRRLPAVHECARSRWSRAPRRRPGRPRPGGCSRTPRPGRRPRSSRSSWAGPSSRCFGRPAGRPRGPRPASSRSPRPPAGCRHRRCDGRRHRAPAVGRERCSSVALQNCRPCRSSTAIVPLRSSSTP